MAALRQPAVRARLVHQQRERADRKQGNACGETNPLGRGHAHAQSGVGSRSGADAHGVELPGLEPAFVQHFLHERRGHRGVCAGAFALPAGGDAFPVGEGHGAQ